MRKKRRWGRDRWWKKGKKNGINKKKKEGTEIYIPFLGNKSTVKQWMFKGINARKISPGDQRLTCIFEVPRPTGVWKSLRCALKSRAIGTWCGRASRLQALTSAPTLDSSRRHAKCHSSSNEHRWRMQSIAKVRGTCKATVSTPGAHTAQSNWIHLKK